MPDLTYNARFSHCDDGICVSFPDLPGCTTEGDTKEEAIEMAKEALVLWLDVDECDKVMINPPRRLDELVLHADGVLEEYENSFEFVPITITERQIIREGSHSKWKGPSGEIVIVPMRNDGNEPLKKKTLESIKKQAGYE